MSETSCQFRESGDVRTQLPTQLPTQLYPAPVRARPLRVVLVVPDQIPRWLAAFADSARVSDWLSLDVVAHADAAPRAPDNPSADIRALLALERTRWRDMDRDPLGAVATNSLTACGVRVAKASDEDAVRRLVVARQPDLVLLAGPPAWSDLLAATAAHGCWQIEGGLLDAEWGGLSLLAPILNEQDATLVGLELDHRACDDSIQLASSLGATYPLFHRQREHAFRKIPSLLLRAMRGLARGNSPEPMSAHASTLRLASSAPSRGGGARALAISLRARARWRLQRRRSESWALLVRQDATHIDPATPDFGRCSVLAAEEGRYWADPCAVEQDERRLVFVEEYDERRSLGVIVCLELLEDGTAQRLGIVLDEPFHLSYPQVFQWQGAWYMTVESAGARRVSLYRATDFPLRWERTSDLVTGCVCVDGTLHYQDGHWYLFVNISESGGGSCDELFLFVADELEGPYRPHPANPVVCDVRRARPAGRLFMHDGRLIRPSQDCGPDYGAALVFNEVVQLDPEHYVERQIARLQPMESLGMSGCHTYSATPRMEMFDAHGRLSSDLPRISVCDAAPAPSTPAGAAPRLSVIVASDRDAEAMARSIGSVLGQDFCDLEMIVATGVSDDHVQRVADGRFRVMPGFEALSVAMLEGGGARSRYVARLPAGEEWAPGHALACVTALERDPQLGAVHAGGTPIIRRSAIDALEEAENPLAAKTPEAQRELLARLSASSGMGVLELEPVPSAGGDADAGIVAVTAGAGQQHAGVGAHYIHYSAANLLVLAAGFISFPILTRLLDNTQYGVLGYYEAWVGLVVAIAKLGTQHSVVRFYPFHGGARQLEHFATNLLLVPVMLSLALWGVSALALGGYDVLTGRHFSPVFWCAFISIPLLVLGSVIEMVFRASERSLLLSVMRVVKRWLELLLVLGAVVLLQQTALAVYWGRLAAAALVLVYCIYWARKHLTVSRAVLDVAAILNSWRYSMPLVVNEMAFIVLMSIDKVMLKYYSGGFVAVGIYTVGYSLAMQVNILMQATFYEAFTPVANRIHDVEGDAGVRALKKRVLMPMTYASIGVAAVILGVGQDALVALSGPTKSASGPVFVAIGMTMALNPLFDIAGYGLLLHKRSVAVLVTSMAAALTNIALNLLLIPRMGVMGAVTSTISSYFLLAAFRWVLCPVPLRCMPPAGPVVRSSIGAIVFVGAVSLLGTLGIVEPWPRLLVGGCLFALLYVLPLWLTDPALRQLLRRSNAQVMSA